MIRIAVVEDDETCLQELCGYIRTYESETGRSCAVTSYRDGTELVDNFNLQFDIILMDVEMPKLDGMTAAEIIRQRDTEVLILFISNMSQYAIRGYEVEALDYILKPVSYFAFSQRLNRAVTRLQNRTSSFLAVPVRGGMVKVNTADILYVESSGHTLLYHTSGQTIQSSGTISQAEEDLKPRGFCRCNKGYLVNLAHVDGIQDGSAVVGGEKLLISRGRRNDFLTALTEYIGGVGP